MIIDRFPVLQAQFPTLWIPETVYDEVVVASGRIPDPGAMPVEEADHAGWIQRLTVHDQDAIQCPMGR